MKKLVIALLTFVMLVFSASDVNYNSDSLHDSFVKIYEMYYAYPEGLSGGEEPGSIAIEELYSASTQAYTQADSITDYGYIDLAKRSSPQARQTLYSQMLAACEELCQSNSDIEPTNFITSTESVLCYVFGEFDLKALGLTISEAVQTWATFKNDHPEYYWFSNQCLYNTDSFYALIYDEYVTAEVRAQKDALIESKLADYISVTKGKDTLLEKALAVHDLICSSTEYEKDNMMAAYAHNILGVLENGKAVCEGYAKLYQLVLNRLGIENIYVTGVANGSSGIENHAWNMVKLDDGKWHTVDTTWDDTAYNDRYVWTYFGMAKNAFANTHTANTPQSDLGDMYFLYDLPESSDVALGLVTLYKNGQKVGVCFNIESAFALMTDKEADYEIKLFKDTQIFAVGDKTPEVNSLKITGNYNDVTLASDKIYCVAKRMALLSDLVLENVGITFDPEVNATCTVDLNSKKLTVCGQKAVFDADIEGEYESLLVLGITNERNTVFNGKVNVPSADVAGVCVFNSTCDIKALNILSNVKEINKNLISSFDSVETINIPADVDLIYSTAFDENTSLKNISVDNNNVYYYSVDGVLYSTDDGGKLIRFPINKQQASFELPQNVKYVADNAFRGVTALNKIKLRYGCTNIGQSAFANTMAIKTVYIPSTVNSIIVDAFDGSSDAVIYCKQGSYIHSFAQEYDIDLVLIDEFTYTFYNENQTDIVSQVTDYAGEKIILPYSPQKPSDAEYDYTFSGWQGYTDGKLLEADISFTAKFDAAKRLYTVKYLYPNGELFKAFTVEAGNTAPLPESTPEKLGDAQFSYVFKCWAGYDATAPVLSDLEFAPEYEQKTNEYTYTFYHEDGQTIITTATAPYGTVIYAPEAPEKENLPDEIYVFSGWAGYTEGMALVDDVDFVAEFTAEKVYCSYTFLDDDNTTVITTGSLPYGSSVPLPQDPTKESSDGTTYVFIGWSNYNEELQLTEDMVFVAQYRSFTTLCNYKFIDFDGRVILHGSLEYGEIIPLPNAPIRPSTEQYSYTFKGWIGYTDGMTIESDVEFTADYTTNERQYSYVFYDIDNTTILKQGTAPYGTPIEAPSYSVQSTQQYIREFIGWDGYTAGMLLTQNRVFTPKIKTTPIEHTYTFKNFDGSIVSTGKLLHGTKLTPPAAPTKAGHRFVCWEGYTEGMLINSDVEFTAVFELAETELKSQTYKIDTENGIISGAASGTSIDKFILGFANELKIVVLDADGNKITAGALATGYTVKLFDNEDNELDSAVIAVSGDVNCDGKITVTDFVMVKSHLLEASQIPDDARRIAADLNGDGNISVTDFVLVKQLLLSE
ncbi:MAG: hypothetical protein E7312_07565 [Clostridiales bacterium]|nr:hypothetical protein [Clostridiales bacterium]